MLPIDGIRAWSIIEEAVKAANNAETFSGEATSISRAPAIMRSGATFEMTTDEDFGISNIFRLLAKVDLHRSMDVARSFKGERPRALAVLAVAGVTLDKSEARNHTP